MTKIMKNIDEVWHLQNKIRYQIIDSFLKFQARIECAHRTEKAILIHLESQSSKFLFGEVFDFDTQTALIKKELWIPKSVLNEETDQYFEIQSWFFDKHRKTLFSFAASDERARITYNVLTPSVFAELIQKKRNVKENS
nr:hypothetical protein [Mycobacterium tuberculosis]